MRRILCLALLCLAGCGSKLKSEIAVDSLLPLEVKAWEIDPPTYDQTVSVVVKPAKGPLKAFLVKESDKDAVTAALEKPKGLTDTSLVLGSGGGESEFSFEAKVPAKTKCALIVLNGTKSNSATVTLAGK